MSARPTFDQLLPLVAPGFKAEDAIVSRHRCPLHHGSDTISLGRGEDGRALLKCWGCDATHGELLAAYGFGRNGTGPSDEDRAGWEDFRAEREDADADATPTHPGCTLGLLSEHWGIPEADFLREGWLEKTNYQWAAPRVLIPTPGEGRLYRCAVTGNGPEGSKFLQPRVRPKEELYAEGDLAFCKGAGVLLVEGPGDALIAKITGGMLAVGLLGAGMWNPTLAAKFDGITTIYLWVEPGDAGARLAETVAASTVRERVRVIDTGKDVRDFRDIDRDTFPARLQNAIANALTFDQYESVERRRIAAILKLDAGDLLTEVNLVTRALTALHDAGVAGEDTALVSTLLTAAACLLGGGARLPGLVIKAASSAGKSMVEKAARSLFPSSYWYELDAASERALIYDDADLAHRVIVMSEASGLTSRHGEDTFLAQAMRVLISEGVLRYKTVVKDEESGRPRTITIEKTGPTGLIVTTTATSLHPENETRMLSVHVDDSPEQTRAVLDEVGRRWEGEVVPPDFDQWRAFFEYLRVQYAGTEVVIPYARALNRLIPPVAVRLRRDAGTLLALVAAHTILHAEHRQRDAKGRVIATFHDYAVVRHYLGDAFSENVRHTVPHDVRETVEAVAKIATTPRGDGSGLLRGSATFKEVGNALGIDREAAARRADEAIECGYLTNDQTKEKQAARLRIEAPLPSVEDDAARHLLPTPDDLEKEVAK